VVTRCVIAASTLEAGKEAAKAVLAASPRIVMNSSSTITPAAQT
jgi:hypothetical protein